jgi:hypothetical protein
MNLGMNALPRWRRWAVLLAQHASRVLPGAASSPWAEAMRREIDYIADDQAALRWAFGCVVASYKARLAARSGCSTREVVRHALACGALMLVIGFALLENAESQTEPPRPAPDQATCDARDPAQDPAHDTGRTQPPGAAGVPPDTGHPLQSPEPSCADRNSPNGILPKYRTP